MKTMTARLTAAFVRNNPVEPNALADLIVTIHTALATCGEKTEEQNVAVPAVPIKKSVKPSAITCLECGKELSMLKRHLTTDHGMTPADYRARWNLGADYPMTAPDYAARRSELAKKIGLGKKKTDETTPTKPRRKKLSLNW
ncbi:MAG TPA: MucR family transcriptional regulator [Telmatospirillum sp.]|nr:MucR family transcriptional regulator [Telmatospirillum sp.]